MSESLGEKVVVAIIGAVAGAVITGGVSIYLSGKTEDQMRLDTQDAIVEVLADEFDDISRNMKFDEAIGQMKTDINELKKDKNTLLSENDKLEKENTKLRSLPKVEYNSIGVVKNGYRIEEGIKNGCAVVDGAYYYSEDSVNSLLESKVHLDEKTSTLFYDTSGTSNPKETKVALENTKVLFDGIDLKIYDGTSSESIPIGSKTYNTGFVLDNNGWYEDAAAFFDLGGDYSKISFDVGRVSGSHKSDAALRVYFSKNENDTMTVYKEYDLSSDVALRHFDIDLNHYNGMKFELLYT